MSLLILAALVLVSVLTVSSTSTRTRRARGAHGCEELVVADGVGGLAVCEGLVHVPEGGDVGADEGAVPTHALAQHPLERGDLAGEGGRVGDAVGVAAQQKHRAATAQLDV